MSIYFLCGGLLLASFLFTGLIKTLAHRAQMIDVPVLRSAHSFPTPVGGGAGIALLFLLVASHYYRVGVIPFAEFMAIVATAFIAALGLIDDIKPLDIRWRVPPQFLAAIWVIGWLGNVPAISFGSWQLETVWILNLLAVLGLVWLLNLFNFMDGIDGIAGSELVCVNLMVLFLVISSEDEVVTLLSATLASVGAGFLLWNWSPAKIFMGDVGSAFIGFSLGVLALLTMHHQSMTIWSWLLLLGVFVADSGVTLIRRFMRRDKWYEGHACHAYQNAARHYRSHSKVTITVILINSLWLAPLAWVAVRLPELGVVLCVLGIVPLVVLAIRLDAGIPE